MAKPPAPGPWDCFWCKGPNDPAKHNGRGNHMFLPRWVVYGPAAGADPALGFDLYRAFKLGLVA